MLNFSLPVAHVLIAECEGGVCCVERLFSSSLVAIVCTSFPCKLRICHFKKGTEICSYNYSSPILALRLNRLVCVIYHNTVNQPSVRWRCWLGGRNGIRPVKNWVVGCWRGYLFGARCRLAYGPADATVSCFSKIQIGFTFLVPAHLGSPGQWAIKRVCVCVNQWIQTELDKCMHFWSKAFNRKILILVLIS